MKTKTIFIQDTFTGDVLCQMVIKEDMEIPFSFKCEFKTLQDKLSTVVAKQWIEGENKATLILR